MYSLLDPLSFSETKAMLGHRCEMAEIDTPFSDDVLTRVYEAAGGVPREILRLCANAYEIATITGDKVVSMELVDRVIVMEAQSIDSEGA